MSKNLICNYIRERHIKHMGTEDLKNERCENNHAVMDGIIPKRVPINLSISPFAMAEYAGVDPRFAYWDPAKLEDKAMELGERIPTDVCILGRSVLNPAKYQALGSKAIIMGANGFIQHPNTCMMQPEEYDEFIKDPYAFIVEKAVPRVNPNLDVTKDPARAVMTMTLSNQAMAAVSALTNAVCGKISARFGYFANPPVGGGGYAPMDILSDQLRSFSGMSTDIRRHKDKVKAAVEAISPANYLDSSPANPKIYTRYSFGFYPLHMATFMREKDFAELWWPAFKRQWDGLASEGYRCGAFLEDDWTRLLDYVQDLPTGSLFTFEYADIKQMKAKLGKKFVLSSGFPIKYLTQCSKEEVVDRTKEWLDVMAVDGHYIFGLDKSILTAADCNLENLEAVAKTVMDYGVYTNPGVKTGEDFNQADYSPANLPQFSSRVYKTWEQYLAENPNTPKEAENIIMSTENSILKFYFALLK